MTRLVLVAALAATDPLRALEPAEIFLLVNKNVAASKEVAEHYCKARGVPAANVVELDVPKDEDISRADYAAKIVKPLREALKDKKDKAKVLLSIHGVPLRVGGQQSSDIEKVQLKEIEPELKKAEAEVKTLDEEVKKGGDDAKKKELEAARKKANNLAARRMILSHAESQACVDSELMLLWWDDYPLVRWQLNLRHWQVPEAERKGKPPILFTCRIDGPTPELCKRIINDAVETEKKGLTGKVYIDARGIKFDPKGSDGGYGYAGYDESFREAAALLKDAGKMDVILDDKEPVFKAGDCPDCALYSGWYSHANFVDSCKFVKGAVAWHLASSEAVSLRSKDAKYWCKNLLEKGACATLGPVAEPYTIGFPKPAEFFGFLATGKYPLVECYGRTVHFASWMGCLVGDPLYNPFAKEPRLKEEDVFASPKGGKFLVGPK